MTLCAAWIRQVEKTEELVFATDSCLSGGERWHSGVKLFELPRKDCLICFAGDTERTYPLILNLISSIKFDDHLSNPHTDISDVLEYLSNLFTVLCNTIPSYGTKDFESMLGDFQFMFGGWSWVNNEFKVWKLQYSFETSSFIHTQVSNDTMFIEFIGDELDNAKAVLTQELNDNGKTFARYFDMEPFKVLLEMIRKKEYDSIDGAIQIAKIHPPGITEFYGVMWPSIKGKKTFLGKDVNFDNNPAVKFIDPDTCEIIGDDIPNSISEPSEELYGINYKFVNDCYPIGKMKEGLTKREKHTLKTIFKEVAYAQFMAKELLEELENSEEA
jgi:hypothetical protein